MKTKRDFNPKFWSHREGRYSGNIICIFAPSRWGFAATNLWVKANKIYYCFYSGMTESSHTWDEINLGEGLLYEPQYYCPGIDCFISAEIKNIINFIRISSRIAGGFVCCSERPPVNHNHQQIENIKIVNPDWLLT